MSAPARSHARRTPCRGWGGARPRGSAARIPHPLGKFKELVLFHGFPAGGSQRMKKIEIKILRLAFAELFVENAFRILRLPDHPDRELAGKKIRVPRIFLQRFAHENFALSPMIRPCGVEIVRAGRHGHVDHFLRLLFINAPAVPRQAHHAEPEKGKSEIGILIAPPGDFSRILFFLPRSFPLNSCLSCQAGCAAECGDGKGTLQKITSVHRLLLSAGTFPPRNSILPLWTMTVFRKFRNDNSLRLCSSRISTPP